MNAIDPQTSWLGAAAALTSAITWAIAVTGYSRLATRLHPSTINATRALVALPVFGAGLFVQVLLGMPVGDLDVKAVLWLTAGMVGSYGVGDVLFLTATRMIGVTAALAIAAIYPVWSALVGWIVREEPLGGARLAGLGLAVAGTIVVIVTGAEGGGTTPGTSSDGPRRTVLGVFLALGTSVFWALNTFAVSEGGRGLSLALASVVRMTIAIVLCACIGAILTRGKATVIVPLRELPPVLPLFLFEAVIGSASYLYGMSHSPLAVGAALSSLSPVAAVPLAWMLAGERPRAPRTLGVLIGTAGVWLLVGALG